MSLISQNFTVDASSNLIFDILRSKIYSDPIKAIIQEIISNARDANREINNLKPLEVICNYQKFSVKDYGPGISPDRMSNVFLQYLATTKKADTNQTGGFGLGAKTPFAYTDSFEIITINNGIKYQYLASIGGESNGGDVILISSEQSSDCSGTEIVIPLNSSDHSKFHNLMLKFVSHFNYPIKYNYYNTITNYSGVNTSDTMFLSAYGKCSYLVLDGIYYSLDRQKLQSLLSNDDRYKKYGVNKDFILSFGSRELDVSVNRESIRYSELTNEALRKKVSDMLFKMEETVNSIIPNLVVKDYINNSLKIPQEYTSYFEMMGLTNYYQSTISSITISSESTAKSTNYFGYSEKIDDLIYHIKNNTGEVFTLDQALVDLSVKNIKKYIKSKPGLNFVFITKLDGYPVTSTSFDPTKISDKKSKALFFKADQYGNWNRISLSQIDTSKKSLLLKHGEHFSDYISALASTGIDVYSLKDSEMINRFKDEDWVSTDHRTVLLEAAEKYDSEFADYLFILKDQTTYKYTSKPNSYYNVDRNLKFLELYSKKYPSKESEEILQAASLKNYPDIKHESLFKVLIREKITPKAISKILSNPEQILLASKVEAHLLKQVPLFKYFDLNRLKTYNNFDEIIQHL